MIEFPPFWLDKTNQCVVRGHERIALTPKAYSVLEHLLSRAGEIVSQSELLEAVWFETYVQPEIVKTYIRDLRRVLGDDSKNPRIIETVARRGDRLLAGAGGIGGPEPDARFGTPDNIFGRDEQLAELEDCLHNAERKEKQIVFVSGEAGNGKTALIDEFVQRAARRSPAVRIARGQCVEGYGIEEPYYPVLQALGELVRGPDSDAVLNALKAEAPTWLAEFPAFRQTEPQQKTGTIAVTRDRMLREMCDVLRWLTAERPLALIFDDCHWIDLSTLNLIDTLARHRGSYRLLVVASYRPVEVVLSQHPLRTVKADLAAHRLCREISVGPLSEAAVGSYLAAGGASTELPAGLRELVYRHSEGNPLFMVAAVEHLAALGYITRTQLCWTLNVPIEEVRVGVPATLLEMIEVQIDRLSEEEQTALEAASAVDVLFAVPLGAAAADLEDEAFESLCDHVARKHHLLRRAEERELPGGIPLHCYSFVHSMYREVLQSRATPGRQAKAHRRIAERALKLFAGREHEIASELALHFEAAADWLRSVSFLRTAAENAIRRYAHRDAIGILRHALKLTARLGPSDRASNEPEILDRMGGFHLLVGEAQHAVDNYLDCAERAHAHAMVEAEAFGLLHAAYAGSSIDARRSLQSVDRAQRLLPEVTSAPGHARATALAAFLRIFCGGWDNHSERACAQALDQIRALGDEFEFAQHLVDYSYVQWVSSDYKGARRSTEIALPVLLERQGLVRYMNGQLFLAWTLMFLGKWGESLRLLEVALRTAEMNDHQLRAATVRLSRAWVHLHASDSAGALEICEQVLPVFNDGWFQAGSRMCLIVAGCAAANLGYADRALDYLLKAREWMRRQPVNGEWYWHMQLQSGLVDLHLRGRDVASARREAQLFLDIALATAEHTWQALAWEAKARVALAERDISGADEHIQHAIAACGEFEVPLASWRVHATAGDTFVLAGNPDTAARHRQIATAEVSLLAASLEGESLQHVFLGSQEVRRIFGDATAPAGRSLH